jgi:hypothetical protein
MLGDQIHRSGVRSVQRTIIDYQNTAGKLHAALYFSPKRIPIQSVGIVRWAIRFGFRMRAGGFHIAEHFLRRYQKVNVVKSITLGPVHVPKFTRCLPTA